MADESGDHPKDVEHNTTHAAANNVSPSTPTAAVSTPCDSDSDWSWTGSPRKPEDLPKGMPCDDWEDSDDEYENSEEYVRRFAEYSRQVKESEGFDVEEYVSPGMLAPLLDFKKNEGHYDRIKEMARQALETFKDDSGKEYELVDVEKVVWTTSLVYYLTMKAKQLDAKDDDDVKMIQAIVHYKFKKKPSIKLCRLKPDNKLINKID